MGAIPNATAMIIMASLATAASVPERVEPETV